MFNVRPLAAGEDDLKKCLLTESLNIVTDEESTVVGSMCVRVSMRYETSGPPALVVRVESTGNIGGSPCGTVVDARLSTRLETLEQRHQEFVKVRKAAYFWSPPENRGTPKDTKDYCRAMLHAE